MRLNGSWTLVLLMLIPLGGRAETAYVTDQFEITLRSGPSTGNKILRMLPTGARLETIETGPGGEFVRVRTENGTEGWVLSRYLIRQPTARERLQTATERVRELQAEREQLRAQLAELRGETQDASTENTQLAAANRELTAELEDIRAAAANVLALREENERLRRQASNNSTQLVSLRDENELLQDRSRRDWFVAGAGVLLLGLLLGLILPRIRWRRRSSWGEL